MFRKDEYPPNWPELRAAVQARADDRCESCGVANHAVGARDRYGDWHDECMINGMGSDEGYSLFGYTFPKIIRIVCTTAHVYGHDKMTQDISRLIFECQRCHLNRDRAHHMEKAALTRARKRGQHVLGFGTESTHSAAFRVIKQ